MNGFLKVVAAGFALYALNASAATPTVFGIELGKASTLPDCAIDPEMTRAIGSKQYKVLQDQTCIHDPYKMNAYGTPVRDIVFNTTESPLIVKDFSVRAITAEDGRIVAIEFFTRGADSQGYVMDTLAKKFGTPTSVSREPVQNGFGARFQNVTVLWKRPDVSVTFFGMTDEITTGQVIIDTPESLALRKSWAKKETPRRGL